eukprot:6209656-Pleurochrysis_carterae.AAC.1
MLTRRWLGRSRKYDCQASRCKCVFSAGTSRCSSRVRPGPSRKSNHTSRHSGFTAMRSHARLGGLGGGMPRAPGGARCHAIRARWYLCCAANAASIAGRNSGNSASRHVCGRGTSGAAPAGGGGGIGGVRGMTHRCL